MGEAIKMDRLKWWDYLLLLGVFLLLISKCTQPLLLNEENICREYNYDTGECLDEHHDTGEYLDENWNDTTKRPYDLHGLEKNNEN